MTERTDINTIGVDYLEIRTQEDDPYGLRIKVPLTGPSGMSPAERLIDGIIRYYDIIGQWPDLEQIRNAIQRYKNTQKLDLGP